MWRTKGSDFESLVYVSGLVFRTKDLNLTSDYHLETWRHLLSRSLQPETLPSHLQSLLDSSRLGATQLHLVLLVSVPLCTHTTPYTTCLDLYQLITTPTTTPSNS